MGLDRRLVFIPRTESGFDLRRVWQGCYWKVECAEARPLRSREETEAIDPYQHFLIDSPLNNHNLVLLLDLECIVEQCIGFVFLYLFDDFRYESGHLCRVG